MIQLSSRQYAMLANLPDQFGLEDAQRLNQSTLGSFARRGYVRRKGDVFSVTDDGRAAAKNFGTDDYYRKVANDRISRYFRLHFRAGR